MWTVHGQRCFWCHHPVTLRQIEIDHILPEGIKPEDFERIREQYNLPEGFSLLGYENLVPSCSDCNSDKGARLFNETPVLMWQLQLVEERVPKIFALIHDYRKANRDTKRKIDQEPDYDGVQVYWLADGSIDVVIRRFKPAGTTSVHSDFWPGTRTHHFAPPSSSEDSTVN
jgi:hypothetical protein